MRKNIRIQVAPDLQSNPIPRRSVLADQLVDGSMESEARVGERKKKGNGGASGWQAAYPVRCGR